MRDIDKLKEKIELSLDDRQVVSLVIGSLVVLGVVFVLGVMVGKQLAVPAGSPPAQDVLAALDKAAAPKPPEPKPEPKLDFQETLPGSVPGSVPPKPEPRAEAKPEPKPEPKPEKKPEPKPEPEVVAKPEPKPEKKPEPVAKAEPKPEPKPAEKPAPAMDKKLADAFTNAEKKPREPAPVPQPHDGFTVQVAASQQKSEADQMMSKLRSSGKSPYLVDAEIPGKGRWYRVRVGSFHSRDEAERYAKDLKRETGINGAFVTSAK